MGNSSGKKQKKAGREESDGPESRKRTEIATEILTTEQKYVEMMDTCIRVYLEPLRRASKTKKPILKEKHIGPIFGTYENILANHRVFLSELEVLMKQPKPKLGAFFVKHAEAMKEYSRYVNNYNDAMETMAECQNKYKSFAEFLSSTINQPESGGLGLGSYLILPIQRIPRYVLLLQDLMKHTDQHHPDYKSGLTALDTIREVADYVNEEKRVAEQMQELIRLKYTIEGFKGELVLPHRHFIREGDASVRSEKKAEFTNCHYFLFNDMIILALELFTNTLLPFQIFGSESNKKYKVVGMADLLDTDIVDLKEKWDLKYAMSLRCEKTNYIFNFESAEKKETFLNELYGLRARAPSKKDQKSAATDWEKKKKK